MVLTTAEVSQHNSRRSCWVIIHGSAYDLTDFLDDHPGGANIILKYAGQDATAEFEPCHPEGIIEETLPAEKRLGRVMMDPGKVPVTEERQDGILEAAKGGKTPLEACISLYDFEEIAKKTLSGRAWTYYSSAAEDSLSNELNQQAFRRVLFRPRVMLNVERISLTTNILGFESSLPFFIAPAALARLAHPEGERALARGAGKSKIIQIVSSNASLTPEQIAEARVSADQVLFFQLYVVTEPEKTERLLARVKKAGYKGLIVTVDTAVPGKRETDERYKASLIAGSGEKPKPLGLSYGGWVTSALSWKDLSWLRQHWDGPIAVKGIMTAEDAMIAVQHGVQAIYLSNHGGRQLDSSPPAILTLLEIRRYYPELIGKVQILLDGGVRRGNDILKAIALGATACGLGRPFLYALGAHGPEGVLKVVEILRRELEIGLRLLGVNSLAELTPDHVNTKILDPWVAEPRSLAGRLGAKL